VDGGAAFVGIPLLAFSIVLLGSNKDGDVWQLHQDRR